MDETVIMYIILVDRIKKKSELLNNISKGIELCTERMTTNRDYYNIYLKYVYNKSSKIFLKTYKKYKISQILDLDEEKFIVFREDNNDKPIVIVFLPMNIENTPTIIKKLKII